jgi:type I restriction enzyme S subunit
VGIVPSEKVLSKYFFFLIDSIDLLSFADYSGAMPSIRKTTLEKYYIPLPPLQVQEEIVRILDTFSGVVAELEAEQAARARQYEHYRNELLSFDSKSKIMEKLLADYCPEGVEYKALGDIGTFFGGLTGKTKQDFQNGNKKFISYMNVYKNPAVDITAEDFVRIGNEERQNTVEYGDILFTGSSETPEECGISSVMIKQPDEPFYLNSFTIGFRLHNPSLLDPEFSKHLFRSAELRSQINKTANGVTRFNVSKSKLSGVVIPLPPLPMQKEIVSILNRFDTLVNDLKSGLPAEIALRRKQYEYYRDKLLTFPQKPGG